HDQDRHCPCDRSPFCSNEDTWRVALPNLVVACTARKTPPSFHHRRVRGCSMTCYCDKYSSSFVRDPCQTRSDNVLNPRLNTRPLLNSVDSHARHVTGRDIRPAKCGCLLPATWIVLSCWAPSLRLGCTIRLLGNASTKSITSGTEVAMSTMGVPRVSSNGSRKATEVDLWFNNFHRRHQR